MKKFILFIILSCAISVSAQNLVLKGKVVDEKNSPLSYAIVSLTDLHRITYTDDQGNFYFNIDAKSQLSSANLKITTVGKRTILRNISRNEFDTQIIFKMYDLSLTLDDVEINQQRIAQNSNSSIVFDREAIEQTQAFSLTDILNNLPGKTLVAPNLQVVQKITLRSEATGIQALNNSLGVAIIIDDIQQSNNANMQNRSLSKWGIVSSGIRNQGGSSYDATFGGLDIREIPADNIESIEVINGIAPAKYGDLTDGAIIINRQAGRTPYQFSTRVNDGSSNFSLSKGYTLPKKWGALNLGVNYLLSNEDPSDLTKSYKRVSTNLIWTSYLLKGVKNSFSVDYNTRLDNLKQDPDDGFELATFAKTRSLNIGNRTSIEINSPIIKALNFSVGYSSSYQESYNQRYINGAVKGITDKDVSGVIYEGYFIPGSYLSVEHIVGNPKNLNGNISLSNQLYTGNVLHNISIGSNIYYSKNTGQGVIVDPTKPRWANTAYQNDRPYSYESLPDVLNYGIYLQDNFKVNLFHGSLNFSPGLRYDVQNNQATLQPRINTSYKLNREIEFTAAYGLSTKAPTLAHRYPSPAYIDLILLNKYTGYTEESILLVYTDKIIADNSNLRSSKSNQLELGFKLNKDFFNSSVFTYFKDNRDGFSNYTLYKTYTLPNYDYTYVQGSKPIVTANGTYTNKYVGISTVANGLNSKNFGIEWSISTKKIQSIQTSFNLSNTFNYSIYHNSGERIQATSQTNIDLGKAAWFGVYPPYKYLNWKLMSKFNIVTHIPKLGFVVNLLADVQWQEVSKTLADSYLPIAYLDKNMVRHEIDSFDSNNPDYGYLALSSASNSKVKLPFSYANMSIRISKEIKQKIRLSVNAYNFLNVKYRYYNPETNNVDTYSNPTSVGAELSIKF